jgi:hypothetical protein
MRQSTLAIMCIGTLLCMGLVAPVTMTIDGGNATVSFDQWQTDPPLNRFPNASPRLSNNHQLIPSLWCTDTTYTDGSYRDTAGTSV